MSKKRHTINILHAADLHANCTYSDSLKKHCEALLSDEVFKETEIDLVIFSGDAADSGDIKEFTLAKNEFFNKILAAKKNLKKENIFVVPGDHDVHRYWDWGRSEPKQNTPLSSLEEKERQLQLYRNHSVEECVYLEFEINDERNREGIKRFQGEKLLNYVSELFEKQNGKNERLKNFYQFRKDITGASGVDPHIREINVNDKKVVICCFNSAWHCHSSRKDARSLFVSKSQLDAVRWPPQGVQLMRESFLFPDLYV